jgi:hypothetical protein
VNLPKLDSVSASAAELDLVELGTRVRRRWPLLLVCGAIGVFGGYLAQRATGPAFEARTTLAVTQQGVFARAASLAAIAHSPALLEPIAARVRVPAARLQRDVAVVALGGAVATGGRAQQIQVVVRAGRRSAALVGSRAIATALLARIDAYDVASTASLEAQLRDARRQLADADRLAKLAAAPGPSADRAVRLTTLGLEQMRRDTLTGELGTLRLQLAQLQVTRSFVQASAVSRTSARTPASSALVGGAIGLLVGVLAALVRRRGAA